MKDKYGLKEVFVPEDKFYDGENKAKCNIFMSKEFYEPKISNKDKTALVLI